MTWRSGEATGGLISPEDATAPPARWSGRGRRPDAPDSLRLAVIDDDPVYPELVALYAEVLSPGQVAIRSYQDPGEAIERLLAEPADAVLLDLDLGDVSGLGVLQELRHRGYAEPIVILTGSASVQLANELWRSGADDFLDKHELAADALGRSLRLVMGARQADRLAAAAHREASEARDQLAAVLQRLRLGVVSSDIKGRTLFVNDFAAKLFEVGAEQALGRQWTEVCAADPEQAERLRAQRQRPAELRERTVLRWVDGAGRERSAELELHDHPADPRGTIAVAYDISDVVYLQRELAGRHRLGDLVGRSPAMLDLMARIRSLCAVDTAVLIEGETGTGKELVARALHDGSPRSAKAFVAVNCAGLSESLLTSQLFGHRRGAFTGAVGDQKGLFEAANGGTIFLDEIGDMPPSVQTALLRVLQEREILRVGDSVPRKIDVRVVAATHRKLAELTQTGAFREDLLYRLRVARLSLPPLRDRLQDIPLLVETFFQQIRTTMGKKLDGVDGGALRHLMAWRWPGNVRELRSAVEYAAIRAGHSWIRTEDLPPELSGDEALPLGLEALRRGPDREEVVAALRQVRGNRSKAAKVLGISRATLYRWLDDLGLQVSGGRQ